MAREKTHQSTTILLLFQQFTFKSATSPIFSSSTSSYGLAGLHQLDLRPIGRFRLSSNIRALTTGASLWFRLDLFTSYRYLLELQVLPVILVLSPVIQLEIRVIGFVIVLLRFIAIQPIRSVSSVASIVIV